MEKLKTMNIQYKVEKEPSWKTSIIQTQDLRYRHNDRILGIVERT